MEQYHKIHTMYKRDTKGNILLGQWSLPEFEYLQENEWIFTEKIDGTNIRMTWDSNKIEYKGKTDNAQIPTVLIKKLLEIFGDKEHIFKEIFTDNVCLYGEGYGAKIQKGGGNYIKDGVDFILFDVKIGNFWLERHNIEDIATKLNLKTVPIIGKGTLHDAIKLTSEGFKSKWGDFYAEGIVLRPKVEMMSRNGSRIITKIKHKDFEHSSIMDGEMK